MKHLIVGIVLLMLMLIAAPACTEAFSLGDLRRIGVDVASRIFLDTEEGIILMGYDQIAFPNEVIEVHAQLLDIDAFSAIQDATITFYEGPQRIGRAMTDQDGLATIEWKNRGIGEYYFQAAITAVSRNTDDEILELNPVDFRVVVRDSYEDFIVVDLDHTLVDSNFFMVLIGRAEPMQHSQSVLERLSSQYTIVYLTHRPDLLGTRSRTWLTDNQYPAGPIILSELAQAFGDSGTYKTQALDDLRDKFPNLRFGIGDKISDVQAYIDNHMTGFLIPHYDRDDDDDIRQLIYDIENITDRWRLQVVDDWFQIENAFFNNQQYPWENYVDQLQDRLDND